MDSMIIITHRKEAVITILIETIIQVVSFSSISQVNECFGQISECHLNRLFSDLKIVVLMCSQASLEIYKSRRFCHN